MLSVPPIGVPAYRRLIPSISAVYSARPFASNSRALRSKTARRAGSIRPRSAAMRRTTVATDRARVPLVRIAAVGDADHVADVEHAAVRAAVDGEQLRGPRVVPDAVLDHELAPTRSRARRAPLVRSRAGRRRDSRRCSSRRPPRRRSGGRCCPRSSPPRPLGRGPSRQVRRSTARTRRRRPRPSSGMRGPSTRPARRRPGPSY